MADRSNPTDGQTTKQDLIRGVEEFIFRHGGEESLETTVTRLVRSTEPQTVLRVIAQRERFWRSNSHVNGRRLDDLTAALEDLVN